jgi:WD40 repeat protein
VTEFVNSIKVLSNGIHLAAGLISSNINIYNLNTGGLISTLIGHTNWIEDLILTNTSNMLLSSSDDQTVRIWNLTTNTCKFILTWHTSNVNGLKQITPSLLASGSGDSTIKLWDTTSGQLIRTLSNHTDSIYFALDTLNDSDVEGKRLVSGSFDGTIKIWNYSSGDLLSTINSRVYIYSLAVVSQLSLSMLKINNTLFVLSQCQNWFI